MQILILLGMYFDTVVVFVTSQTLLFTLALAIPCYIRHKNVVRNGKKPVPLKFGTFIYEFNGLSLI